MLSFLPAPVLGVLSSALLVLNLVFWIIPFYLVAVAKLLIPVAGWRRLCDRGLTRLAEWWIGGNDLVAALHNIDWDVEGVEGLRYDEWYLVISNHQSWVDIFVLQHVFNRRIPFLKFFLKKQLIWVPLLGLAWWALDLPFMQRHSREAIEKRPELRGQDLETTRRACEHFRYHPTAVINFVEGTRFTPEKHRAQRSPYRYLLRPKAGGIAFVIGAMGEIFHSLVDVTIAYPRQNVTFWDLMCGRIARISVRVTHSPIPAELRGDYLDDPRFREQFQRWLRERWEQKDEVLSTLIGSATEDSHATSVNVD